ncbi:hypothetical protein F4808DRAFT_463390 [Astrocystis sublimbata]|nr:hypothetical protein F4808DRAFT_463390 [Astrocystis sublimbata]
MSFSDETVVEFENRQKDVQRTAQEHVERGDELSTSLERLRTAQRELINSLTNEAVTKWMVLVCCMEAAETRALAQEVHPATHPILSTLRDKLAPDRYKHYLPIPDIIKALQKIQNKAESLRDQADGLERSAGELFADSTQLGERVSKFVEEVQDHITEIKQNVAQLATEETNRTEELAKNGLKIRTVRVMRNSALVKAFRWKKVGVFPCSSHDQPGQGSHFSSSSRRYVAKTTASSRHLDDLGHERNNSNMLLKFLRAQIKVAQDQSQRLEVIGKSGSATVSKADQTRIAARELGQRSAITANNALTTIRAVRSTSVKLRGRNDMVYMHEREKIMQALAQHLEHIDSSGGTYNSLDGAAMRELKQGLQSLQTSRFSVLCIQQTPDDL